MPTKKEQPIKKPRKKPTAKKQQRPPVVAKKAGRPTKYDAAVHPEEAFCFGLLGLTNEEIASQFEIDIATFYRWQEKYTEFCEALRESREAADAKVAQSMYQKAKGYTYKAERVTKDRDTGEMVTTEVTVTVEPDVRAAEMWLRNRQPKRWRDTQHHKVEVSRLEDFFVDNPGDNEDK